MLWKDALSSPLASETQDLSLLEVKDVSSPQFLSPALFERRRKVGKVVDWRHTIALFHDLMTFSAEIKEQSLEKGQRPFFKQNQNTQYSKELLITIISCGY